ncbi:hypothetical protein [Fructilactobacillus carniphilus]|uniref:Uncharacterized protein n=1 Tax=Fructilactobacillus carniphilus TaxID=2940297 RepID=A0ABY5BX35_9LACO|nr:hypothetical protein [Fructilactobacillus carniphilus]USS91069.1 hypothetical protein M3M37_02335 [Fructilactobacillus carniphilus]
MFSNIRKPKLNNHFAIYFMLYNLIMILLMIVPYIIIIYGFASGKYIPVDPLSVIKANLVNLVKVVFNNSFTIFSIFAILTPVISVLKFYNNYKNSETHNVSLSNPIKLINVLYHKQDVTFLFVLAISIVLIPLLNYFYSYYLLRLFFLILISCLPIFLRLPTVIGIVLISIICLCLLLIVLVLFLASFHLLFKLIVPFMKRLFFPNTYLPLLEINEKKYCIVGNDQEYFFLIKLNERYMEATKNNQIPNPDLSNFTDTNQIYLFPREKFTDKRIKYFKIQIHFLRPYIKNFKNGQLEVKVLTSL